MSWQSYVDDYLMVDLPKAGGKLQSAAIVGLDGGIWAQSAEFPAATTEQLMELADAFQSETPAIQSTGIKLGADKKFFVVFYDYAEKIMRGKLGNGGISVKVASTCLVIGIYSEKDQVGDANDIIENMADYLKENNY